MNKQIEEKEKQIQIIEERLAKTKNKLAQMDARKRTTEAAIRRRKETHIKIILGGMIYKYLKKYKPDIEEEDINYKRLEGLFSNLHEEIPHYGLK